MDQLVLTRAKERAVRGRTREQVPSRFLDDVEEGLLQVEDRTVPVSADSARERLAAIRAMLSD